MAPTDAGPLERARENAVGIVSTAVTGLWLAALVSGFKYWLALLLIGYVVVVPLTAMLSGDEDEVGKWWTEQRTGRDTAPESDPENADAHREDALATLRERYARGDLTDEQFERKLERLLETETLEDVAERARTKRRTRGDDVDDSEVETESER
jgi:uncharacterized membrane protein